MIDALIIVPEITKGMKSIGSKSLLEIKKKLCILEYQIESLYQIDKNIRITIGTGFESEKIISLLKKHKTVSHVHNTNYKTTNHGYLLKLYFDYKNSFNDLLIISNGILLKNKCINKTMLNNESKIFLLDKEKENFNLGCADSQQEKTEYIFYDLPQLWSECLYLSKKDVATLQDIMQNSSIDQLYLFEIVNEIINKNGLIKKEYINKKNIMKINSLKDLAKARNFI